MIAFGYVAQLHKPRRLHIKSLGKNK